MEEHDRQWIGPMLYASTASETLMLPLIARHFRITAQLVGPQTKQVVEENDLTPLQDLDLVVGPGRGQYASLTWEDLTAIAPWLELANKINGPGLGH